MLGVLIQWGTIHSTLSHDPDVDILPKAVEVVSLQVCCTLSWYLHEFLEGVDVIVMRLSKDQLLAASKNCYRLDW